MNDENKTKTVEEKFFAEYHELQEISGNKDEWLKTFLRAFKALDVTVSHNGSIHVLNSICFKGEDGYAELKKIVDLLDKE